MNSKMETLGLLLAAMSSFFFSIQTIIAKVADLTPILINWYGSFGMVLLSAPIALSQKSWKLSRKAVQLIALRSVVGTICHITAFAAIEYIPLGDASVLFYTSPVFTIVLARVYLKEPCTVFSTGMIVIVMIGIILVTQPPLEFLTTSVTSKYAMGVILALLSSLTDAINIVMLRDLKLLHYSVLLFLHGILSLVFSTLLIPFTRVTKVVTPTYPLLMSLFSALEQLALVWALNLAKASPVSTCQVLDVIFAYLYQIMFFGEKITMVSILGASVIISAVVMMTLREEKSEEKLELILPTQHVY